MDVSCKTASWISLIYELGLIFVCISNKLIYSNRVGQAEVNNVRTSEATQVLDRLKHLMAAPNDAALAKALDISPQTLGSWRARASIPYAVCMDLARSDGISLDWLLLGRGGMLPEPHTLQADTNESLAAMLATLQALSTQDQEYVHRVALDRKLLRQLQREVASLRNNS